MASTTPPIARTPRTVPARQRRGPALGRSLPHVALLLSAFAWIYPLLWGLSGALKTDMGFLDSGLGLIPHEYRWHNFVDAWNSAGIGTYFVNTVLITVATVFFTLLFSSAAGYVLARTEFPGRRALLAVIAVTFFLPRGYTIIPVYDLVNHLGLLDSIWAVVLVQVANAMVFNTFMFMGYFRTVTKDVEEAAMVDGATFHQLYFRIALPLARPMLASLGLFVFISSWNDFLIPLVFTLGRPERQTISVGLYSFIGQTSTDWSVLCAGSVISLLPIVLVFAFAQRHVVSAIAGAVKG
ncbi:carbohydrate ABC transporter membrane protein 2, CUT1 family [Actinacidiphila alni]|uniref:Carbohydrate ABC transporter membrane protein 2, CUT1 family n=1 Tax=Actinacidiphila alni TaxID=380248 RepID=A0A1I2L8J6_9ACTN|nr:carbohydrate ABC transporter permease [Actinacidiphila alni]SFF75682.1 carbohydrate ABC transporter membrane protein 2, CUT1 family [Actinacidiphila alni]